MFGEVTCLMIDVAQLLCILMCKMKLRIKFSHLDLNTKLTLIIYEKSTMSVTHQIASNLAVNCDITYQDLVV